MDRVAVEVACPAIVHNTAFSAVIKGFKPLGNGRTKSERNKCFFVLLAEVIIDKALFSRRSGATKYYGQRSVIQILQYSLLHDSNNDLNEKRSFFSCKSGLTDFGFIIPLYITYQLRPIAYNPKH